MNEETGTILDFIYTVFDGQPKSRGTFHLTLDFSQLNTEEEIVEYIFKQLTNIFVAGCKIKFGNIVLLEEMVGDRLEFMNEYFNSFGYQLFIDAENENTDTRGTANKTTELKDHYLKINRNGVNYYIYFDELESDDSVVTGNSDGV